MKLYTKSGDKGQTGLFGGQRVSKAHVRVAAYGEVDELNSALGVARTMETWDELDGALARIQNELFDLGSRLATPPDSAHFDKIPEISEAMIHKLEGWIDRAEEACEPLKEFILPGGSKLAAWLLYVRCICRRAERSAVELRDSQPLDDAIVMYLNRLSDLLFVWGREANARAGVEEPKWQPAATNQESSKESEA